MTKNSKRQLAETRTSLTQQRRWWNLKVERRDRTIADLDKEIQDLERRKREAAEFADKAPGAIIKINDLLANLDQEEKKQSNPAVKTAKSTIRKMKQLLKDSPEVLAKLSQEDLAVLHAAMNTTSVSGPSQD